MSERSADFHSRQDCELERTADAIGVGAAELSLDPDFEDLENRVPVVHDTVGKAGALSSPVSTRHVGRCSLAAEHVESVGGVAGDIVVDRSLLPNGHPAQRPESTPIKPSRAVKTGLVSVSDDAKISRSRRGEVELSLALNEIHSPLGAGEHFDFAPGLEIDADAGGVVLHLGGVVESGQVSTQLTVWLERSDKFVRPARLAWCRLKQIRRRNHRIPRRPRRHIPRSFPAGSWTRRSSATTQPPPPYRPDRPGVHPLGDAGYDLRSGLACRCLLRQAV